MASWLMHGYLSHICSMRCLLTYLSKGCNLKPFIFKGPIFIISKMRRRGLVISFPPSSHSLCVSITQENRHGPIYLTKNQSEHNTQRMGLMRNSIFSAALWMVMWELCLNSTVEGFLLLHNSSRVIGIFISSPTSGLKVVSSREAKEEGKKSIHYSYLSNTFQWMIY